MKRLIRRILGWLVLLFLLLNVIPFGIPLSPHGKFNPGTPFAESQFANIDNVSLHYRLWAPRGEHIVGKLLLVHGMGGSTFGWEETVGPLQEAGYLVVAVDLPAFGYSERNPKVNHGQANRSRLLWGLADEIDASHGADATGGWTLIGHSMGGGTVAAMAMDRPSEVNGLVLVAGALFDNNPRLVSTLMAYPPLGRWLCVVAQNILLQEGRIAGFLSSAYGREATSTEVEGYLTPLTQPGSARGLLSLVRTAKSEPPEKLLTYTGPSLALWGENDAWVPPSQIELVREFLPGIETSLIVGAAHVPMETHAAEFNASLLSFLRKLP